MQRSFKLGGILLLVLGIVLKVWTQSGYESIYLDTDIGRDLKEISNIQAGHIVWLGPRLGPGLHASSIYYYLFYPAIALSGGSIASLVTFNLMIGLVSMSLFGYFALRTYGFRGAIATLVIGLLPLMTVNALHPGNGFTYMFFILMCLALLWFKAPLILGSLAGGMAVALHPAAGFLPLFLLYEWWLRDRRWQSAIVNFGAFLVPLGPLIAFEVITKGFIVRSFLAHPSSLGISLGFTWHPMELIGGLLGFHFWPFLAFLLVVSFSNWKLQTKREKIWYALSCTCLFSVLFFHNLVGRYLFGIALITIVPILFLCLKRSWTTALLAGLAMTLLFRSPLLYPLPAAARPITEVETTANQIADKKLLDSTKKIAIVAALSEKTEVPQADDYRFLLRNRGYQVVEVTEHAQAEQLVLVVEVFDFKWETWSTWEIESFGARKLEWVENLGTVTVVVFSKV